VLTVFGRMQEWSSDANSGLSNLFRSV